MSPLSLEISDACAAPASVVAKPTMLAAVKQNADNVVVYVRDGFVYVYGRAGNVLMNIKVAINGNFEFAKTKALASYLQLKTMVEGCGVKLQDKFVLVKGKFLDGTLMIKGKLITGCEVAKAKALDNYAFIQTKLSQLPVPVKVKDSFIYLKGKAGNVMVYIQDSCMYVYGKVGGATVAIKVKGIKSYDLAKEQANKIFTKVADAVQPYTFKVKDGLTSVKGKVGDVSVCIKSNVSARIDAAKAKTLAVYSHMQKVVEDLSITGKIKEGVTVVNGKLSDVKVYVKDGFVHASATVDNTSYYIKTQIVKVRGGIKVKILEAWSGVEALAHYVADIMLGAADYTKSKAGDKPVAASAMGGAVMLGAGGGAAGGVVGGIGGAIAGMPLAFFTFGLSIPIGAVVGGGAGTCIGAATGSAAGAVGGSVAGYGYGRRAEIKSGMDGVVKQATAASDKVKAKIGSSLNKLGTKGKIA